MLGYLRSFEKKVVLVVSDLETPAKVRSVIDDINILTLVFTSLIFESTKNGSPSLLHDFLSNSKVYDPLGIIQNTYPQVIYAIVNFYLFILSKVEEKENLFKGNIAAYIKDYFDKSSNYLNNFVAFSETFGVSLELFLDFFIETFKPCFPDIELDAGFVHGLKPLEFATYWYIAIFLNRSYISEDCCKALLETNKDEYKVSLKKMLIVIYRECFEDDEFKTNNVLKNISMFHFGNDNYLNFIDKGDFYVFKKYLNKII